MNDIRRTLASKGLIRSGDHRLIAGVSAGLGRRIGVGPWTARFLFVLAMLVIPGSSILIYPILWFLMPSESRARSYALPPAPGTPPTRRP